MPPRYLHGDGDFRGLADKFEEAFVSSVLPKPEDLQVRYVISPGGESIEGVVLFTLVSLEWRGFDVFVLKLTKPVNYGCCWLWI
jgi:hypothetical protein